VPVKPLFVVIEALLAGKCALPTQSSVNFKMLARRLYSNVLYLGPRYNVATNLRHESVTSFHDANRSPRGSISKYTSHQRGCSVTCTLKYVLQAVWALLHASCFCNTNMYLIIAWLLEHPSITNCILCDQLSACACM